jgi:8-oxo-dGTP pyrophosphatase MutT (NUDIX family)
VTPVHEALVVVHRPGPEFLVLLRSPDDHGYWHLVAGGVEKGEAPDAAALRELEEETGLGAPIRFEPLPHPLGYRRVATGIEVTLHPFAAEVPAGWEPVLNEEHVDYRWCTAEDAVELLEYWEPQAAVELVARRLGVEA